jgi:Golgi phosphoprotein 3
MESCRAEHAGKQRLAQAIVTDEIPDTRDIMLVSIAEPCGLLRCTLRERQLEARRARIAMLCHLETISRKVAAAIGGLESIMRQAPVRMS